MSPHKSVFAAFPGQVPHDPFWLPVQQAKGTPTPVQTKTQFVPVPAPVQHVYGTPTPVQPATDPAAPQSALSLQFCVLAEVQYLPVSGEPSLSRSP